MKKLTIVFIVMTLSASLMSQIAETAEDVCPVKVGMKLPEAILKNAEGKDVNLYQVLGQKPTLLIVYRGGWCPYCNMHLAALQEAEEKILDLGIQIIAVSADRPDKLKESYAKHNMDYTLLSDSQLKLSQKMGLAFKMPEEKVKAYKNINIDLEDASGETHHSLPVPGAFLVDLEGLIHFSYVNPNYKVRIKPNVLLAAAESMVTIINKTE